MGHLLCDHKPARVDIIEDGLAILQNYDKKQELEADWLAGALLVPRSGLLRLRATGTGLDDMAKFFEVSTDMIRWRKDATAVDRQLVRRTRTG